jgi:hypothetical protein
MAVAEWLIFRLAAAAEGDYLSASQAILFAFGIVDCEISFDADWAVVGDCDFGRCHESRW